MQMDRQRVNSITRRALATALGLSMLSAGALMVSGSAVAQQPKAVKIAVVVPLSGAWARQGQLVKMGAETAAAEINAAGGVKALGGAKIELPNCSGIRTIIAMPWTDHRLPQPASALQLTLDNSRT
jgi:outer membrane PBP1 activator LpoA protein